MCVSVVGGRTPRPSRIAATLPSSRRPTSVTCGSPKLPNRSLGRSIDNTAFPSSSAWKSRRSGAYRRTPGSRRNMVSAMAWLPAMYSTLCRVVPDGASKAKESSLA